MLTFMLARFEEHDYLIKIYVSFRAIVRGRCFIILVRRVNWFKILLSIRIMVIQVKQYFWNQFRF